jgi:outer membrane protein assembly factor BamB
MYRIIILFSTLFLFFAVPAPFAGAYGERSPRIVWQTKAGNPASELQLGPNGLFYLPTGNKLVVVDDTGRKLWEAGGPSGSGGGRPVFDAFGSIFFPGGALIQEIKLNGSQGWNFAVYQGSSNAAAQLTAGPGNLLYMPLSSALYAVDTVGRYKWMLLQWDSGDAGRSKVADREILACAGNEKAVFVVTAKKGEAASLVTVSGEGKVLWRYWLGDLKSANLVTGRDGLLYATVNPGKLDNQNKGTVYAFGSEGGGPLWSYPVKYDDLTAPTLSEGGLLYFCAGERLYAINRADGKEAWYEPLYKAISRPAVDDACGRIYLGTDDKRLLAVTPEGRLDWELTVDGKVSLQPLARPGGYLYAVTDAGTLYKIKDEPNGFRGGNQ